MIRMIQSRSSGHAKAYFSDALSKSDYYVSDQELAGYWQGRLAARLGLTGATDKESFFDLCENRHPVTGGHLTPLTKEMRTVGYDINFHCPKSVSLVHAFSNDDHVLQAFRQSVTETMREIEADSKTRVRRGGVYDDRDTGELAWGHFVHQTARPVEHHLPDPHLHSHCYVFNATWDEAESRIKAGQFRDIKRDMPFYQAQFHKRLSDRLADLGYSIRQTEKSFEIEGVPQRVLDLFSKRTDEIGRIAKEKGITDPKELDALGAFTRAVKQKGYSMAELKQSWRKQIFSLGKDGGGEGMVRHARDRKPIDRTAEDAVDHALLHCFERASVISDRRLLAEAYRYSVGGGASVRDITEAFKNDARLIHVTEKGQTLCTTKEVLLEEKHMVDLAKAGQGKMTPLYDAPPLLTLDGQQKDAVEHVLTTANRVSIIRGAAGTGKTTLMKEAVAKIKEAGKTVTVVAPTAQASRGVLKEEGFTGAETVARLLTDPVMQEGLRKQVLWVDEAGLLGTKDMLGLLALATRQDARLILGGDTRQHASVVRGDALRILNTVAGIRSAEVSKIYRQKNEDFRAAVEHLSKGDIDEGFKKLDNLKFIHELDPLKPEEALVNAYMSALKNGKSALVISPTHAQGEAITQGIRARMKANGMLGKKEIAATQLKNLNLTEAEKADSRNFDTGQRVQFIQNVKGFPRGSLWRVEKDGGNVSLKNAAGETKNLPINKSKHFSVYEQREIPIAKGDKIRITDNSFDANKKRLDNGTMLEVIGISKSGEIRLRNEQSKAVYTLDKSFGHLAHAHCITSYASQGKNIHEVFIYQPAATFPATDAKQFYVSVSRAKERVWLFTDDKEELLQHASELGERRSASELVDKKPTHQDYVEQMQRQPKTDFNKKSKAYEFDR